MNTVEQYQAQEAYIRQLESKGAEAHVIRAAYDILNQLDEQLEWEALPADERARRTAIETAQVTPHFTNVPPADWDDDKQEQEPSTFREIGLKLRSIPGGG